MSSLSHYQVVLVIAALSCLFALVVFQKRLWKTAAVSVIAIITILELYFAYRPELPVMTAGLPGGSAAITQMLQQRFPIGSPASDLESELVRERYWGPVRIDDVNKTEHRWRSVHLERWIGLFVPEATVLIWKVGDDGRITDIEGSKWIDITML